MSALYIVQNLPSACTSTENLQLYSNSGIAIRDLTQDAINQGSSHGSQGCVEFFFSSYLRGAAKHDKIASVCRHMRQWKRV